MRMSQLIRQGLLCLLLAFAVTSEEPFCGNKCYDSGVATSRNCYCDIACSAIFNDCCGDSEYNVIKLSHVRHKDTTCTLLPNGKSIPIVKNCSSEWQGPDSIRNSCNSVLNLPIDPVGSVPVTNYVTGVSYSNYYCAICNGESQALTFWKIKISCPSLNPNLLMDNEEALNYIFYEHRSRGWGYFLRDGVTNSNSFHSCNITSLMPILVAPKVRYCDPLEVSMCSHSWKNDVIREMCGTYSDPVFVNSTRYKNFYCAICNRVDQSDISCGDAVGPRNDGIPDSGMERDKSNFALLLDVNLSNGNNVGKRIMSTICGKGEIFDPFAKKCRNIVCGVPGYVLDAGRCTMEQPYKDSEL